ncbi:cytochrome c oxidase assembly protein [Leifsonia sp. ZF2019]|uniref:cytochrome c oxidase assembly protein n=1 Tax=Leifsonia sp. ZF2019 TaxID=2781978 RepID=UPI001CBE3A89|nr:cytochrome c oxidase assembly protein [Leifsonia sp. ZF2019]UAJ78870.1 cytochrome c oxidase assembly protein [Leifsonia sp. ZF2019]
MEPATPPVTTFLTTWSFDPAAAALLAAAAALYLAGVLRLRRHGHRWPARLTVWFLLLGLGSYAWISFGFLGAYSTELRWAFTTRIALLLFVVPALMSLGRPIALARAALSTTGRRRTERVLRSRVVRVLGNAMFAPVFACAVFLVFLTPVAAVLRTSPWSEWTISVLVPLAGMLLVLPIAAHSVVRTGFFITVEFLLAFVELLLDAIPGLLLRLNDGVLDGAARIVGRMPFWFPTALHDQHLSGDFLWFIAEVADVPILVILFVRWMRLDRREAKRIDDLTDEQLDALTRAHLERRG